MRKSVKLFILLLSAISSGYAQNVTIGSQVWSTKNLDVATFRNGDLIPQAKTKEEMQAYSRAKEAAWCYYEFNPKNGNKYGKMYNGYALTDPRGLAPIGWHIPSRDEYKNLIDFLGGEETARFKLKSNKGWASNGNGTNSSGFSGLPGGRTAGAKFLNVGYESFFWSSTPMGNDGFVYGLSLSYNDNKTYIDIDEKNVPIHDKPMFIGNYISNYNYIRCVKD